MMMNERLLGAAIVARYLIGAKQRDEISSIPMLIPHLLLHDVVLV